MQAENGIDLRVAQAALLDHDARPAFLAHRRRFLRRLKNELHRAANFLAQRGEDLRDAHQHRHMRVMAAGVHHASFGSVPLRAHHALERNVGFFSHGQCVHVRAKRNTRTRLAAFEHPHHAGIGDLFAYIVETESAQMRGNHSCGFELAIAELGVGMNLPAPFDYLLFQAIRMIANQGVQREQRIGCIHRGGLLVWNRLSHRER